MIETHQLHSYAGHTERTQTDGQPSIRLGWDAARNSRHVTRQFHQPPIQVAGWVRPTTIRPDGDRWDGIHIHVGHISNERNYVVSLVRRDSRQKIAVEYGWGGYQTIDESPSEGVELVEDRTYLFTVTWDGRTISSWVGSEAGRSRMLATIPHGRWIPTGAVGLRLDNLQAVAGFDVKGLT